MGKQEEVKKQQTGFDTAHWAQYGELGQTQTQLAPFMKELKNTTQKGVYATGMGLIEGESARSFAVSTRSLEKESKQAQQQFQKLTAQYALLNAIKKSGRVVTAEQITPEVYAQCKNVYGMSTKDVKKVVSDAQQGKMPEFSYEVRKENKQNRIQVTQHENKEQGKLYSSVDITLERNPFHSVIVAPKSEKKSLLKEILDKSTAAKKKQKENDKSVLREQGVEALRDELRRRREEGQLRSFEMVQLSEAEMKSYEKRYGLSQKEVAKLSQEIQAGVSDYDRGNAEQRADLKKEKAIWEFRDQQHRDWDRLEREQRSEILMVQQSYSTRQRDKQAQYSDEKKKLEEERELCKGNVPDSTYAARLRQVAASDSLIRSYKGKMVEAGMLLKNGLMTWTTPRQLLAAQAYKNAIVDYNARIVEIRRLEINVLTEQRDAVRKIEDEISLLQSDIIVKERQIEKMGIEDPENEEIGVRTMHTALDFELKTAREKLSQKEEEHKRALEAIEQTNAKIEAEKNALGQKEEAKRAWESSVEKESGLKMIREAHILELWSGEDEKTLSEMCGTAKLILEAEKRAAEYEKEYLDRVDNARKTGEERLPQIEEELKKIKEKHADELRKLMDACKAEIAALEEKHRADKAALDEKQEEDFKKFKENLDKKA